MKRHDFFQTPIWIDTLNIDNNKLINEMKIFQKNNIGASVSNAGGYQGQNFFNQELNDNILRTIPKNSKELNISHIHFWININKKGDSNGRHAHGPYSPIFLCGVYYAKVPKNSGRFKFYDPRGSWMQSMSEYIYYDDGFIDYNITPQDGMIIFFPSWLEHSVEENKSDEERITIAFNIMLDKKNDYGRQKWFMCSGNSIQGYFNQ